MSDLFIFGYSASDSSSPSTIDISFATVTLATALTYNGSEQTQTVSSVVVNGVTLTENTDYTITDNTATNAGSYTLSILGTGGYSGTKTASWSIAKAQGSVSVNPSSLSIQGVGESETSTVSVTGDGAVSVSSSDDSVATASISGNTITVTSAASGSATITVTLAAGTNYTGDSVTISVSVVTISPTLSDNTPEQIKAAAQAGIASSLWSVGAMTAPIHISATNDLPNFTPPTEDVCAFIIGFDHNSSIEGTNRIHFQFGKTTSGRNIAFCDGGFGSSKSSGTWFNMNNYSSTAGGWNSTPMRTIICPAFKSALPSAWQNAIATTTKYTDNVGGASSAASYVTATADDIFLLAEYEVFGTRKYANSAEQNYQLQYDYYKNGNAKIKYKHNSTSTACIWLFRSVRAISNGEFCGVNNKGTANTYSTGASFGFAPGFSIA